MTKLVLDMEKAKQFYIFEQHRVESFKIWPFQEKESCSIKKMAEAGFYWCGNERENDTAACFACHKVLDGWESTDDPWEEHKKHSPQCFFIKLGRQEKDLTVEEFINLLENVFQNILQKHYIELKKKVISKLNERREKIQLLMHK